MSAGWFDLRRVDGAWRYDREDFRAYPGYDILEGVLRDEGSQGDSPPCAAILTTPEGYWAVENSGGWCLCCGPLVGNFDLPDGPHATPVEALRVVSAPLRELFPPFLRAIEEAYRTKDEP